MTARFSIVPAIAFTDPRLSACDVRVLGVLGSFLDKKNECFPTQGRVAQEARLSRQRVNKAIKNLVLYGYVVTRQRFEKSAQSTLIYKVLLDDPPTLNEVEMQPELFDFEESDSEKGQQSSLSSKATAEQAKPAKTPKPQQSSLSSKATADSSLSPSLVTPPVTYAVTQEHPHLTSPVDSSVSNETAAKPENGSDEDDLVEPPSQPSRNELLKRLIFATGVPLLTGQGMRDQAARGFLGSLVKTANLEIVSRVLQRAANDPPLDAKAWLRAGVLSEARRAGIRVDLPSTPAQAAVQAEEDRAMWERRCAHLAKTGQWRPNWGQDPRGGVPDGMPIEFYDRFGIDRPGRRTSQRSVQPQAPEAIP